MPAIPHPYHAAQIADAEVVSVINDKTPGLTETFHKQADGTWTRKVTIRGITHSVEKLDDFRLARDGSFEFTQSDGAVTFQTTSMRSIQNPSGEAFSYFSDMTGTVGIARVGPEKRINVEVLGKRDGGWFLKYGEYEVSVSNVQIRPDGSYSYTMPDGKEVTRSPHGPVSTPGRAHATKLNNVWSR